MSHDFDIIIPAVVKQDIEEIILYYYQDRREYAHSLFNTIYSKIQSLKKWPAKGKIVTELEKNNITGIREILESHYRIVYRIEKHNVIILTVIDGRRNVEDVLIKKLKRQLS